jgi:hypothetical protein
LEGTYAIVFFDALRVKIRASASIPEQEIEQKAQEARAAIEGPEGDSLRRAEQIGKEHSNADKLE